MSSVAARSSSRRLRSLLPFTGLGVIAAVALLGPTLLTRDPLAADATALLQPPGWQHLAGTDQLGRDVFSRVVAATRIDLAIGLSAVLLAAGLGTLLGAASGYLGGWADAAISRLADMVMAFPLFILAMAVAAALGPGVASIVIATAVINLPFYLRFVRIEVNARLGAGWVEAARLSGNGPVRVVASFILPDILPLVAVQLSLNIGWAILNTAGLSFLGLGIQPPTPEWGTMIADGAGFAASGNWWLIVFPGGALVATILCFNLAGDALRALLDPARAP